MDSLSIVLLRTSFPSCTQPEILRVWGLGRLLGEKPAKETTPDRWISSTTSPAGQEVPVHESISQETDFKGKSSSNGQGFDDIAVANLDYNSTKEDKNHRSEETPTSPRSGAELFQKGLKGELAFGLVVAQYRR